jgi:hypothetical protein
MSSSENWELEILLEVWNNKTGERFEVGPDRDGLGLIEIRYRTPVGEITERIVLDKTAARLVADSLYRCADRV